jgi:hypothetical protein
MAGPVIVAVHVHGNATVDLIERYKKLRRMGIADFYLESSRISRRSLLLIKLIEP